MNKRKTIISVFLICLFLLAIMSESRLLFSETAMAGTNQQIIPMATSSPLSNAVFSVVQSGTQYTSQISLGSVALGTNVSIDIKIENVTNIWAWTISTVTWNPAVVNLTQVTEGPFLLSNTQYSAYMIGNSPQLWDNVNGVLNGGLAESMNVAGQSHDFSGIVSTLIFTVVGSGNCQITIGGATVYASDNDLSNPINVKCNSATVTITDNSPFSSPTATATPQNTAQSSPTSTVTQNTHPTQSSSSQPTSSPTPTTPELSTWIIVPLLVIPLIAALAFQIKRKTVREPVSFL